MDTDPNESYNAFSIEFLKIYDQNFPTKIIKTKKYNNSLAPWMTKALLISIRKKNKLYKKFLTSQNSLHESRYKKYKNKLTHLIKIAKNNITRKNLRK